jgi:hypothetical protein
MELYAGHLTRYDGLEYWVKSLSGRWRSSALVKRDWHRSSPGRRECPTAGMGPWAVTRSCHDSETSLTTAAEAGRREQETEVTGPEQEMEAASWERELEARLGKSNGKGRRGWAPHRIAFVSYLASWYSIQIWYRTPLSLPLWCATSIFLLSWTAWYCFWYQRCDQSYLLSCSLLQCIQLVCCITFRLLWSIYLSYLVDVIISSVQHGTMEVLLFFVNFLPTTCVSGADRVRRLSWSMFFRIRRGTIELDGMWSVIMTCKHLD